MLSVNDFKPEAVIVGAGEFPSHPIPLKWLEGCQRVVCCDGAADRYLETGMPIWRIVGDCDSLSPENSLRHAPIIRRFADQETNDQTKAALYLHGKGYNHIAIIAATGMREDHTLGNISLLIDYMRQGIDARIYTDYGVFIPVSGTLHSVSRRHASVNIQLWSNEIPRRRIALSTPRLYKLVAGHTQRHRQRRLLNRSRRRLPRIHKLRK